MSDEFGNQAKGLTSPATKSAAITPNDGADIDPVPRAVWVGSSGDITGVLVDDPAGAPARTFANVPGGCHLPYRFRRILATGTNATGLVGLS